MRYLLSIVLTLLLQAPAAWSAAEPYGRHFLALDDLRSETAAPTGSSDPRLDSGPRYPAGTEGALRERLAREEIENGPYAPAIAETLADLARLLEAQGKEGEALRLRERALHLVRVNEGLYSSTQGPLVRDILDSLRRRGAFETLDERYAYFYRLYGSGRPPFDEIRWAATLEYLAWQREALLRRLDSDPRQRLIDLYRANDELLSVLRESDVADWRKLRDVALSQLATLHFIEDMVEPEQVALDPRYDAFVRRDDPRDFDVLRERLSNLQRLAASTGRRLVEEALASVPPAQVEARLELRLALADWLQWQGARREAHSEYEAIWREAKTAGLDRRIEQWFSEPVPLPASGVFEAPGSAASASMAVSLRVSDDGRARVRDDAVDEARRRELSRLRRHLHATRFRPAMAKGKAVEYPDLAKRWVLLED